MQDTKFAWADDELPTRREERERERQRDERAPTTPAKPTAATLRELEPPRAYTKIDDTPAPINEQTNFTQPEFTTQAGFTTPASFTTQPGAQPSTPSYDSLFDPAPASAAPLSEESLDSLFGAKSGAQPTARRSAPRVQQAESVGGRGGGPLVSTAPAWIIAMIPLFQLVLSLLLLTALGMGSNVTVFVGILTVPYLIVIALAFVDFRMLKNQGIERPAHWAWAFLTAPVYLLARARSVIRESGHGIGPVLVWFGLGALHLASVVAIPGLLIAILPGVFTTQLEASVQSDALLISGAEMYVTCPTTPPVLFGEETVCKAVSSSGKKSDISVSLERANGWIEWQVLDWGVWGMEQ